MYHVDVNVVLYKWGPDTIDACLIGIFSVQSKIGSDVNAT